MGSVVRSMRALLLRRMSSVVVARAQLPHGMWDLSSPDQGSNPCPLHWKVDSLPLDHQGNPSLFLLDDYLFMGVPDIFGVQVDSR